jgi:sulfite exporter TauE/SafE
VAVVGASVVLVVVVTATIGVPTTAAGGRWSGIVRMCLRPLPTLPGLLALEIVGKKLQEILRCVARRLTHLLVVLVFPLVTSL